MKSLDMDGPFALSRSEVARVIRESLPGNFAFGVRGRNGGFIVQYVGRGDRSVRDALVERLPRERPAPGLLARLFGKTGESRSFKFSYAVDAEAAYAKHCRTYHSFGGSEKLSNDRHPVAPAGSQAKCEVCGR